MPSRLISYTTIKDLLLLLSTTLIFYLLSRLHHLHLPTPYPLPTATPTPTSTPLTISHLHFSIASSSSSLPSRVPYISLWYSPNTTNAHIFLDRPPASNNILSVSMPPVVISSDYSRFPYTYPRGLRSAIRIARIVKETVTLLDNVNTSFRWFVFGDDDTVFFKENLVKVLSKYDDSKWFYIGSGSESYEQTVKHSFDMAFGGGGFVISAPLARVLAGVMDACLLRYPHLYGSDDRIFACLTELGVGLTRELGFHQVDVRGSLFGMLTAHPLSPLLSLHHLDAVDPIFPGMGRIQALEHLLKAAQADPTRILQLTVCYDRSKSLTLSVAWGYAIQVSEGEKLLPDLLGVQRTFRPWRGSQTASSSHYMFTIKEVARDSCGRPVVFFLQSVKSNSSGVCSEYAKQEIANCVRNETVHKLKKIIVFSQKLDIDTDQLKAPRRQCCHILSPENEAVTIRIRQCRTNELISMQT